MYKRYLEKDCRFFFFFIFSNIVTILIQLSYAQYLEKDCRFFIFFIFSNIVTNCNLYLENYGLHNFSIDQLICYI